MEKTLTITLKGEDKHADRMEFNLTPEEIRDFFCDVTKLLVLNQTEHKYFKVALRSCVETIAIFEEMLNKTQN